MIQTSKTLRRYLWIFSAIFNRHKNLILGAFFGGLVLFIFSLRIAPFIWTQMQKDHSIIGMVGSYTPTNLPIGIQRLISIGLTDVTTQGESIPALANEWSISEDGKEYTFSIRTDLIWHDGKTVSAFDVNYNLKDVEFLPQDDATLKVKLKEPFTPLPSFLSKPLFRKGLIGIGTYKVSAIRLKGEHVNYLKLEPLFKDLPHVEIKFYPSESVAKTAFKLGEINMLDEIIDATTFAEWNTVNITEHTKHNQYVGIFFNLNDEFLKDKEIRQGLAFAIEKSEKNRVSTPLSNESWAYTTRVKQYEKDEKLAKELIGKSEKERNITLSTFPQYIHLAQTIAAAWTASGINTKVKVEDRVPENYQAFLATQEIPLDPDQYTFWHSTQKGTNITGYSNPKIDKLLEDGRQEEDADERKAIYFDFQRYLVEDAPAIFLFHPTTYTIIRK